jgi:hypothetical protein
MEKRASIEARTEQPKKRKIYSLAALFSLFISFFKVSNRAKWLFFEALFFIAVARIATKFYSFQRLLQILGTPHTETSQTPLTVEEKRFFYQYTKAIDRASKVALWHTMCYEQALTAKLMLRRRKTPCTIYIGMSRKENDQKLEGHAWLRVQDFIVTGNTDFTKYVVVGVFS